jgi:hypothetical protein
LTYVDYHWARNPAAGIGIVTGLASGLIVVDVDGPDGEASAKSLYLPATPTVETGKGRHLYFQRPDGGMYRNRTRLKPGVDVRADGGYVCAPPTTHASGKEYQWADGLSPGEVELASAPRWLIDATVPPDYIAPRASGKRLPGGMLKMIDLDKIPSIGKGERNNRLASLCGRLHREGRSASEIEDAMRKIGKEKCDPPLSQREIETIMRSVARYHR